MAKKRNVILDFEANLNKLVTSLGKLDKIISGHTKGTEANVKANQKLLTMYEKQAKALQKISEFTAKNASANVRAARQAPKAVAQPVITPKLDPKIIERQMNDLARRIDRASSFSSGGTSMYRPLDKHGKPLSGSAREAALYKRAKELNVPTDNLGKYGFDLTNARARDAQAQAAARMARQQAVAQRYEQMRQAAMQRQAAQAAAQAQAEQARLAKQAAAETWHKQMQFQRRFGVSPSGAVVGGLGKVIPGTPFSKFMSPTGGFSGAAVRGAVGRAGLTAGGTMLGGAMGGAAAAVGGAPVLAGLALGKLASTITAATTAGVKMGFKQAFQLTGMTEGFREIMGAEGFNPIKYTEMMLKSKQELLTGTGSGSEADRLFKYATEIAKTSPFQIPDYTHAAAVSGRYGVDISKAYGGETGKLDKSYTMGKALGDLAAGTGKTMEDAIFTFIHEFIATADARSLKYRFSITPEQLLAGAKQQGFRGNASTVEGRASMVNYYAKGQFGGATDRLSGTLAGKISNIRDSLIVLQDKLGQTGAYMNAVNYFERIRVAIEKLDKVDPTTGTSQLDSLAKMFTQVTDKLNEWFVEPVVAGFEQLFQAGSLEEVRSIIVKGLSEMLISAVKLGMGVAAESIKGILSLPGMGVDAVVESISKIGRTENEIQNLSMSNVRGGSSANSGLYAALKAQGMTDEGLRGLGAVSTRTIENSRGPIGDLFFGKKKTTGEFLNNDKVLETISRMGRDAGLSMSEMNSIGLQARNYIDTGAASTKAQAKVNTPEYVMGTAAERAKIEAEIAVASKAAAQSEKNMSNAFGFLDTPAVKSQKSAAVSEIIKEIAKATQRSDFAGNFDLSEGRLMSTGKSAEQVGNEEAAKTLANSIKPAVEKLSQIYTSIMNLKDAVVGSIQKLYDIQRQKDDMAESLGQKMGESPFKAAQRRKNTAKQKLNELQAQTAGLSDSELTESQLQAQAEAANEVFEAIGSTISNDRYADPSANGAQPGSRTSGLREMQQMRRIADHKRDQLRDRERQKVALMQEDARLMEEESRRQREGLLGSTDPKTGKKEMGAVEIGLRKLFDSKTMKGLDESQISERLGLVRAHIDNQDKRRRLGYEPSKFIPKEILDMMGGSTMNIDTRTGKELSPEEVARTPKEFLKPMGGGDYLSSIMTAQMDPEAAANTRALEAAETSAAELAKQTGVLEEIRGHMKTLVDLNNGQGKGAPGRQAPKGSATNAAVASGAIAYSGATYNGIPVGN